jgi:hypothetical protein
MEDKLVYTGNSSRDKLNQALNSSRGIIPHLRLLLRHLRPNPRTIPTNLRPGILNLIFHKQLRLSSLWLSSNHIRPLHNSNLNNTILNLTHPRNTRLRLRNNSSSSSLGTTIIFITHLLNNCALTSGRGSKRMVRIQGEGTNSSCQLSLSSSLPRLHKGLPCMDPDRIKVMEEEGRLGRWEVEEVEVGTEVEVVWAGGEVVEEVVP